MDAASPRTKIADPGSFITPVSMGKRGHREDRPVAVDHELRAPGLFFPSSRGIRPQTTVHCGILRSFGTDASRTQMDGFFAGLGPVCQEPVDGVSAVFRAFKEASASLNASGIPGKTSDDPGSTASVAVLHNEGCVSVGHVGDSPVYLVTLDESGAIAVHPLTEEHTALQKQKGYNLNFQSQTQAAIDGEKPLDDSAKHTRLMTAIGQDKNQFRWLQNGINQCLMADGEEHPPTLGRFEVSRFLSVNPKRRAWVVVASDGLDKHFLREDCSFDAEKIADAFRWVLKNYPGEDISRKAATALADKAEDSRSDDNVTALVCEVPRAPLRESVVLGVLDGNGRDHRAAEHLAGAFTQSFQKMREQSIAIAKQGKNLFDPGAQARPTSRKK